MADDRSRFGSDVGDFSIVGDRLVIGPCASSEDVSTHDPEWLAFIGRVAHLDDWDESAHPRGEGGLFVLVGAEGSDTSKQDGPSLLKEQRTNAAKARVEYAMRKAKGFQDFADRAQRHADRARVDLKAAEAAYEKAPEAEREELRKDIEMYRDEAETHERGRDRDQKHVDEYKKIIEDPENTPLGYDVDEKQIRSEATTKVFEDRGLGELHKNLNLGWVSSSSSSEAFLLHAHLMSQGVAGAVAGEKERMMLAHAQVELTGKSEIRDEYVRAGREADERVREADKASGEATTRLLSAMQKHGIPLEGDPIPREKIPVGVREASDAAVVAQATMSRVRRETEEVRSNADYAKGFKYNPVLAKEMREHQEISKALTQAALEHDFPGKQTFRLYRGISGPVGDEANQANAQGVDRVRVESRAATSWTTDPTTAVRFARFGHTDTGAVLVADVPREAILAYHGLYKNTMNEDEFVVGGMDAVPVRVASSWGIPVKGRYPHFDAAEFVIHAMDQEDWLRHLPPTEDERVDDWDEALHPRGEGGLFTEVEGSSGSSTSESSKEPASESLKLPMKGHQLDILPKHILYTDREIRTGELNPDREHERETLKRVVDLPEYDGRADGAFVHDEEAEDEDAEAVKEAVTGQQEEAIQKFTYKFDTAIRALDEGKSFREVSRRTEEHWNAKLEEEGYDLAALAEEEDEESYDNGSASFRNGLENLYYEKFDYPSADDYTEDAKKALEHIRTVFEEVDPSPGVVYRGLAKVDVETVNKILDSEAFSLDSMSSFSQSIDVARRFAKPNAHDIEEGDEGKIMPQGFSVVLRVRHASGVAIAAVSHLSEEREVLLPKETRFRVLGATRGAFRVLSFAKNIKDEAQRNERLKIWTANETPTIYIDAEEIPRAQDEE